VQGKWEQNQEPEQVELNAARSWH